MADVIASNFGYAKHTAALVVIAMSLPIARVSGSRDRGT